VPAWCRIGCRISIYPGVTAQDAAREIEARITKFALDDPFLSKIPPSVTFHASHTEGYVLEPGSEAEDVLADAHLASTGKRCRAS